MGVSDFFLNIALKFMQFSFGTQSRNLGYSYNDSRVKTPPKNFVSKVFLVKLIFFRRIKNQNKRSQPACLEDLNSMTWHTLPPSLVQDSIMLRIQVNFSTLLQLSSPMTADSLSWKRECPGQASTP